MFGRLRAAAIAATTFAGTAALAAAPPPGCTAYGYHGGWAVSPPAYAPYPACNTIPSFATSTACMGRDCSYPPGWVRGY